MSKTLRKIIHCDCDCFYASIEVRDNPNLANLPVAVGGSPERRGVIATCNYEARKFGIHSALASATARKRCPDLIIIRPDMEKYRVASTQIHQIFRQYTQIIEPLSLDEAFLDVTEVDQHYGSATGIAQQIRDAVRRKIGITISAGIAPNKFLAKIASDWNKPDGQFVIKPDQVDEFVANLGVNKLFGVGKVTEKKLRNLGLNTCGDLRKLNREELQRHFGSFGERLYQLSHGIDDRPVQTKRTRKSLSVENTYATDLNSLRSCQDEVLQLHQRLTDRLEKIKDEYLVSKQYIKIKFHDFVSTTVEMLSNSTDLSNFHTLMEQGFARGDRPVRLLGLGVKLVPVENEIETPANQEEQLSLSLD